MPCYYPSTAWYSTSVNPSGKRSIVFNRRDGHPTMEVQIPCNHCIGCRLRRSREWGIRMVHESELYDTNCFLTLTYSPEYLPPHGSLVKKDFQDFMKRFRRRFDDKIRYFYCGEYGEQFSRPHFHACIFNFNFDDKYEWKRSLGFDGSNANLLFRSPELEDLWPYGFSSIGSVTYESAAYVAGYVTKKVMGKSADSHYLKVDKCTGEIAVDADGNDVRMLSEYADMSRRGGIGRGWIEKYYNDVYRNDCVVVNGREMRPPKFYDKWFELYFPEEMKIIKNKRIERAKEFALTEEGLRVKEEIALYRFKQLKRSFEV